MANLLKGWAMRSPYQQLSDPEICEDKTPILNERESQPPRAALNGLDSQKPWILSTILFALLSAYLFFTRPQDGFATGFSTDLAAARSSIHTEQRRFTGGVSFDDDGIEFLRFPQDEVRYVGEPTDEMDEAWTRLTEGRYFLLSEDEARAAWGPEYREFWNEQVGGYSAGFDMMHLLHCLDHIRKAFYPDRYPMSDLHGVLHRDHCIDSLRQVLMCNGDTTPIPTRWYPSRGVHYIDSDRHHTCRNFASLREFVTERSNGSLAVTSHHTSGAAAEEHMLKIFEGLLAHA